LIDIDRNLLFNLEKILTVEAVVTRNSVMKEVIKMSTLKHLSWLQFQLAMRNLH